MCASRVGVILVCVLALAGCADINSISRRSNLPSSTTVDGRALHLDAKQRVVLAKAGTRDSVDMACAEPSPDALSAFASSVGGGISVSGQGAGSAASALSEAAASIGLRTQSITLMRDALYRVCEAYYNGQLSKPQVMALMARSQDLTAAVVSVEQLTGAIVAQQAALGGASSAASSATMLSNAQALAQVRELEKRYGDEVAALTIERDKAVAARDGKRTDLGNAKNELAITPETDTAKRAQLQTRIQDIETKELPPLETAATDAQTRLSLKEKQLADITKARAAIESQLDSSITSASAAASSHATLSGGSVVSRIDKETAESISKAVISITTNVINKNYVINECMAALTGLDEVDVVFEDVCLTAIEERMRAEALAAQAAARKAELEVAMAEAAIAEAEAARARAEAQRLESEAIIRRTPTQ